MVVGLLREVELKDRQVCLVVAGSMWLLEGGGLAPGGVKSALSLGRTETGWVRLPHWLGDRVVLESVVLGVLVLVVACHKGLVGI